MSVCAHSIGAGAPTGVRARDLAFLLAHLLYRAIHKCILSFFPSVSLPGSPIVSVLPVSSHWLGGVYIHLGLLFFFSFFFLFFVPPLSLFLSFFFFHALCLFSPFPSSPPIPPLTRCVPQSPRLYVRSPFRLLTVSLRRVLKSVVKPGHETGQSAGPRNCVHVCVCVCLPYTQARRHRCTS